MYSVVKQQLHAAPMSESAGLQVVVLNIPERLVDFQA